MEKMFKTAIFGGFKKKAVINYISELGIKTQNEIDTLEDENSELKKEIAQLKAKCEELEKNTLCVGDAIISAERKAKEIIENATLEAVKKKELLEEELKQTKLVQKKLNEEIRQLKASVTLSVSKYQEKLESLIKDSE